MTIKDWPADDRPREKLLAKGAAALSDAELLAILLRSGLRGKSAVELGQDLLRDFGGLPGLFAASPEALEAFKGLGLAKTVQLSATHEIVRRLLCAEMAARRRPDLAAGGAGLPAAHPAWSGTRGVHGAAAEGWIE